MAGRLKSSVASNGVRAPLLLGGAVLLLWLVLVVEMSGAAKLSGTKQGEKITGTRGADRINGMSGNDRLKGKGGNDSLNGGKGRDTVIGDKGADKMSGGAGRDVIKAADGRKDKVINGGPGRNRCVIDTALELSVARHCGSISGSGPGGGGGGGGAGAPGLVVENAEGLICATPLPICVFTISGTGADALLGTVTGGGGVTAVGGSVAISGPDWDAAGLYGCTSDGFLRVSIGSEFVDVPVDCTV
jgi:RTX calcium-binding nonapeptide repeat (4 copies)